MFAAITSLGRKTPVATNAVDLNTASLEDIVSVISAALAFEGFDPIKTRAVAVASLTERELIILLTAYVATGNALAARTSRGRVVNKGTADAVLAIMRAKKITTKGKRSTDITLPRLAISFPALVIAIRLRTPPVHRVDTSTPWELQDLCLNGYAETTAATGSDDFIRKFSLILNNAANRNQVAEKKVTDSEALNRLANFRETAKAALSKDAVNVSLMSKKITKTDSLHEIAKAYGMKATVSMAASASTSAPTEVFMTSATPAAEVRRSRGSSLYEESTPANPEEEKIEPEDAS
jgi:hypothetical protein